MVVGISVVRKKIWHDYPRCCLSCLFQSHVHLWIIRFRWHQSYLPYPYQSYRIYSAIELRNMSRDFYSTMASELYPGAVVSITRRRFLGHRWSDQTMLFLNFGGVHHQVEDDFAPGFSTFHALISMLEMFQWPDAVDVGPTLTLLNQLCDFRQVSSRRLHDEEEILDVGSSQRFWPFRLWRLLDTDNETVITDAPPSTFQRLSANAVND